MIMCTNFFGATKHQAITDEFDHLSVGDHGKSKCAVALDSVKEVGKYLRELFPGTTLLPQIK